MTRTAHTPPPAAHEILVWEHTDSAQWGFTCTCGTSDSGLDGEDAADAAADAHLEALP